MISDIFNTILYEPLYNGFIFLLSVTPFHSVGFAIIALTIIVRALLMPLMHRSVSTQAKMKEIEPEIRRVKEEHPDSKEEQSRKIMELYRAHGINPFSSCMVFIVQIPVILALFWIFHKSLENGLSPDGLYSFVQLPDRIEMDFLGIINLGEKSIVLAALAGITQYIQIRFSQPRMAAPAKEGPPSMKDEFMRNMQLQMKYGFPVLAFFLAYTVFASAVALYWTTSNLFSIIHELFVRRKARMEKAAVQ